MVAFLAMTRETPIQPVPANKQDRARNDQCNLQLVSGKSFADEDETQRRSK